MNFMVFYRTPVSKLTKPIVFWVLVAFALLGKLDQSVAGTDVQEMPAAQVGVGSGMLRGTWVWNKASWFEPSARDTLFNFLKQHGMSVILVQIHTDYSGSKPKLMYPEQLSALLQQASREKITVHALDGDPGFIYPPWREKLAGQIEAVDEFNSTQPSTARFVGVHYDIEPYLLPAWRKDWESRLEVCKAYVSTLEVLAHAARAHGLQFSVDIPPWFDTSNELKPFEMHNQSGTLLDHVADIVDWFGIMAYRNHASGPDGILSLSEGDIKVMEKRGKKAWIGVETGPNGKEDPQKITFSNRPIGEFNQAVNEVETQMTHRSGYGGLLIHCYERYREYLGEVPVANK
jgi:hypothetical protein